MSAAMPKVRVYPLCSECKAPYVLRRVWLVFGRNKTAEEMRGPAEGGRMEWLWQRDCKHKKAPPVSSSDTRHAALAPEARR